MNYTNNSTSYNRISDYNRYFTIEEIPQIIIWHVYSPFYFFKVWRDSLFCWAMSASLIIHKGRLWLFTILEIFSSHHSLTTAMQHQKKKVRFIGYHLIKKHASVLISRHANCVLFQSCDRTLEATSLILNI